MGGDLSDQVEYFEHGRAAPDDAVELEVAQQLQLERVDAPAALKLFGEVIERLFQARCVDRFRQVIVGAAAYGVDRGFNGMEARHQDDEDARIMLQCPLQERQAVHSRRFQVAEDNATPPAGDLLEGVVRIRRAKGGEPELFDGFLQHPYHVQIVIENADAHGLGRRGLGRFRPDGCAHSMELWQGVCQTAGWCKG